MPSSRLLRVRAGRLLNEGTWGLSNRTVVLCPLLLTGFLLVRGDVYGRESCFLGRPCRVILFGRVFSCSLGVFRSGYGVAGVLLVFAPLSRLFFLSLALPSLLSCSALPLAKSCWALPEGFRRVWGRCLRMLCMLMPFRCKGGKPRCPCPPYVLPFQAVCTG